MKALRLLTVEGAIVAVLLLSTLALLQSCASRDSQHQVPRSHDIYPAARDR